jgi:hypothetical protein
VTVRGIATAALNSSRPAWLRISINPATGNGGEPETANGKQT